MATKRKSAKRGSKRKPATRTSPARKSSSAKSSARKRATKPKGRKTRLARAGAVAKTVKQKTLKGIDIVVDGGGRAWDALKSTTSNVVESVRERIGEELSDRGA